MWLNVNYDLGNFGCVDVLLKLSQYVLTVCFRTVFLDNGYYNKGVLNLRSNGA